MLLPLDKVRLDPALQMRVELDPDTVAEYADAIRAGCTFPPIVVFWDFVERVYWLADGFHRWYAFLAAGRKHIECDVREGTRRDAILYAVGANTKHGRRRDRADCRRAVVTLLDDPEWVRWSNREIARRCGVSDYLVRSIREERDEAERIRLARRGEQVYEYESPDPRIREQIADVPEHPTETDCPRCAGTGRINAEDPMGKHRWRITLPDGRLFDCRANTKSEARALAKAHFDLPDRLPPGTTGERLDDGGAKQTA